MCQPVNSSLKRPPYLLWQMIWREYRLEKLSSIRICPLQTDKLLILFFTTLLVMCRTSFSPINEMFPSTEKRSYRTSCYPGMGLTFMRLRRAPLFCYSSLSCKRIYSITCHHWSILLDGIINIECT